MSIEDMATRSGRIMQESGATVNLADLLSAFTVRNRELQITVAPTVGTKTIGTTAAAVYAGASARLTGGNYIRIDNTVGASTIYYLIGATPTAGATGTGIPILPGDYVVLYTALAVNCIADASNANVRIEERVIA